MNSTGIRRKQGTSKKQPAKGQANKKPTGKGRSNRSRRATSKRPSMPRTAVVHSRKSTPRMRMSRANSAMSLTELQFLAKDRGIPFGGLTRMQLIKKINNYMW